jgi:hypothetical protein
MLHALHEVVLHEVFCMRYKVFSWGVSCLQCQTAVVSGFAVLRMLIIETYSLTEFANVDVYGDVLKV